MGNIYYNVTNIMDKISSYIKWWYYMMYYTCKIEFEDFVKSVI